jgi:O-antigen/teichoic acid export membrane protein
MLGYSGWIMIGAAASVGKNTGTPIIVNYFFGTLLNAAYSIANQLNRFLLLFTQGLTEAAIPQITKSFSGGDNKRVLNLAAYISKYSFFLLFLPALPILLETKFLIHLWIGEIPNYTILFCKLMIINALVESLKSGIPAVVQASGKIKWFQIFNSTLLLLGLPITFLLFKFDYPPHYSITVYIIISVINILINIILLKKIINFDVKFLIKTSYFRACVVILSVLPLFFIVSIFDEGLMRFIITVILSIAYYLIVVYFIGLENKERIMVNNGKKFAKYIKI